MAEGYRDGMTGHAGTIRTTSAHSTTPWLRRLVERARLLRLLRGTSPARAICPIVMPPPPKRMVAEDKTRPICRSARQTASIYVRYEILVINLLPIAQEQRMSRYRYETLRSGNIRRQGDRTLARHEPPRQPSLTSFDLASRSPNRAWKNGGRSFRHRPPGEVYSSRCPIRVSSIWNRLTKLRYSDSAPNTASLLLVSCP